MKETKTRQSTKSWRGIFTWPGWANYVVRGAQFPTKAFRVRPCVSGSVGSARAGRYRSTSRCGGN